MLAHTWETRGRVVTGWQWWLSPKRLPEVGKHLGRVAWAGTQRDASLCHWDALGERFLILLLGFLRQLKDG